MSRRTRSFSAAFSTALSTLAIPALSLVPALALVAGCASTPTSQAVAARVTPGLANVPWISGSTAIEDQRQPDVVSNGLEACGRGLEHSRLWNQWPPCPQPSTPPIAGRQLLPTSDSQASAEAVRPWREVTVFGWPCTPASEAGDNPAVIVCNR